MNPPIVRMDTFNGDLLKKTNKKKPDTVGTVDVILSATRRGKRVPRRTQQFLRGDNRLHKSAVAHAVKPAVPNGHLVLMNAFGCASLASMERVEMKKTEVSYPHILGLIKLSSKSVASHQANRLTSASLLLNLNWF